MAYAVIRTGGKQYRVREGDRLRVERLPGEPGQEVLLEDVLAVGAGADLAAGPEAVAGRQVRARILRHGRGPKIRVFKFKRRKGYHHHQGHRQGFTEIEIAGIS